MLPHKPDDDDDHGIVHVEVFDERDDIHVPHNLRIKEFERLNFTQTHTHTHTHTHTPV